MKITKNSVFESRFGFHPVDYETFRKLKQLHKLYWQTVYDVARWERLNRKTVTKNVPEPLYCSVFVEEKHCYTSYINKDGHRGVKFHSKKVNDHGVIQAYQSARMPKESSDDVEPIHISISEIEKMISQLQR